MTRVPQVPARSASLLAWGLVLLVVGQVVVQNGRQAALEQALRDPWGTADAAPAFYLTGGLLSLFGLVWLVVGVHRLARAVDGLARRAAEQDRAMQEAAALEDDHAS